MPILFSACVIAFIALTAWLITLFSDEVIYQGPASLIVNNFEHYSATHRTLSVVPHQPIPALVGKSGIFVATVTRAEAELYAKEQIATRTVTVRRHAFGTARVTLIK